MKKKIGKIVFVIVILAFLIIQIYPVLWLFMASVKPTVELSSTPFALPKVVTFENFARVLSDGMIGTYMWNSLKSNRDFSDPDHIPERDCRICAFKVQSKGKGKIYAFFYFRDHDPCADYADPSVYFLQ